MESRVGQALLVGGLGPFDTAQNVKVLLVGFDKAGFDVKLAGLHYGQLKRLSRARHVLGRSDVNLKLFELALGGRSLEVLVEPLLILHIIKRFLESSLVALGSASDSNDEPRAQKHRRRPFHELFLFRRLIAAAGP